jgi:hypothetical protein
MSDQKEQSNLEKWIRKKFTNPLLAKELLWKPKIRIFCDGGYPIFRWYPRISGNFYAPYWKMYGFRVYIWGREISFSFGEDVNGLYKNKGENL